MRSFTALACLLVACHTDQITDDDDGGKADFFGDDGCRDGSCLRERDALRQVEDWNASLSAADREAKYCAMAQSPFVFFRGTNHLFWLDLAWDPRLAEFGVAEGPTATRIWLQGDLHAENFGAFDDDQGRVIYDLNDFDEASIDDYQLDLWRMATSLVLVAQDVDGLHARDAEEVIDAFVEAYLDAVADFRGNDDELEVRATAQNTRGRLDNFLRDVAEDESREGLLDRWTVLDGETRRFDLANDDLAPVDGALSLEIVEALEGYQQTLTGGLDPDPLYFRVLDVARRLNAGTGSLGTPRFYVLIDGETDAPEDDRILDVKRQARSTPSTFRGPSPELVGAAANEAERVVLGQRALLNGADDHLGWLALADGVYSVRERSPFKASLPLDELDSLARLTELAAQWGEILAADHCRADQDFDEAIIGYSFDRNVDEVTDGHHDEVRALASEVALWYARQVNADFEAFTTHLAVDSLCQ